MLPIHYIFIDKNDIFGNIHENLLLIEIKKIHNCFYKNNEHINYYGYKDIIELLKRFDVELYDLYIKINQNYAALLADIGRFVILYFNPGIYHDLKFISTNTMNKYLNSISSETELIAEQHPSDSTRVRNGNIVVIKKHSEFLKSVLNKIKTKLINSQNGYGSKLMWDIGSGIYINEFKIKHNNDIYKYDMVKAGWLLNKYTNLFQKIKKWNEIEEYIFIQKNIDNE